MASLVNVQKLKTEKPTKSPRIFYFALLSITSFIISLFTPTYRMDANFPVTKDGRVYHVDVKQGEVSSRILTVGDHGRARRLADQLFDPKSIVVDHTSSRGFLTLTGRVSDVPVSIVAIGMGLAAMDFFLREVRHVVNAPMAVIRLGTCGTPSKNVKLGAVAMADAAILISRNYDAWADRPAHASDEDAKGDASSHYNLSKQVPAHPPLANEFFKALQEQIPNSKENVVRGTNVTADSFYSSQGRIDARFTDHNEGLLDLVTAKVGPSLVSLEMETFGLLHTAYVSRPVYPIQATAAAIVIAQRHTNDFLDHDTITARETAAGRAALSTLASASLLDHDWLKSPEAAWNQKRSSKVISGVKAIVKGLSPSQSASTSSPGLTSGPKAHQSELHPWPPSTHGDQKSVIQS